MDREEFIEKCCQILSERGGSKSELQGFREVLQRDLQNQETVKESPEEVVDFWMM